MKANLQQRTIATALSAVMLAGMLVAAQAQGTGVGGTGGGTSPGVGTGTTGGSSSTGLGTGATGGSSSTGLGTGGAGVGAGGTTGAGVSRSLPSPSAPGYEPHDSLGTYPTARTSRSPRMAIELGEASSPRRPTALPLREIQIRRAMRLLALKSCSLGGLP